MRSISVSNISQIVYSNCGLSFLHGHTALNFWTISRKCYHLLKWKFRRLVWSLSTLGLKQSNGSENQRYVYITFPSRIFKSMSYYVFRKIPDYRTCFCYCRMLHELDSCQRSFVWTLAICGHASLTLTYIIKRYASLAVTIHSVFTPHRWATQWTCLKHVLTCIINTCK